MPEYADKMFELFRRLESGAGYSGAGIGLAICSKIVKNHGGSIRATGNPGNGANFEIRLPVRINYIVRRAILSTGHHIRFLPGVALFFRYRL